MTTAEWKELEAGRPVEKHTADATGRAVLRLTLDRPDRHADAVGRLEALCAELGLECDDLDMEVHQVASDPASDTNNSGLAEQLRFLLDGTTEADLARRLRDIEKDKNWGT